MTLKSEAKFEEKLSKVRTLIGSFCAKYITFDQKRWRRVIFNDTDESCKI